VTIVVAAVTLRITVLLRLRSGPRRGRRTWCGLWSLPLRLRTRLGLLLWCRTGEVLRPLLRLCLRSGLWRWARRRREMLLLFRTGLHLELARLLLLRSRTGRQRLR
jgi:hypothetical protein